MLQKTGIVFVFTVNMLIFRTCKAFRSSELKLKRSWKGNDREVLKNVRPKRHACIDVTCSKMFPTLNQAVSVWINFGNPFPFAMVIWRCRFWVNIHCLFEVLLFVEIAMVIMHNNTLQTVGFFSPNRFKVSHARRAPALNTPNYGLFCSLA